MSEISYVGRAFATHHVNYMVSFEFFLKRRHSLYDGTQFVFCFHFYLWI